MGDPGLSGPSLLSAVAPWPCCWEIKCPKLQGLSSPRPCLALKVLCHLCNISPSASTVVVTSALAPSKARTSCSETLREARWLPNCSFQTGSMHCLGTGIAEHWGHLLPLRTSVSSDIPLGGQWTHWWLITHGKDTHLSSMLQEGTEWRTVCLSILAPFPYPSTLCHW